MDARVGTCFGRIACVRIGRGGGPRGPPRGRKRVDGGGCEDEGEGSLERIGTRSALIWTCTLTTCLFSSRKAFAKSSERKDRSKVLERMRRGDVKEAENMLRNAIRQDHEDDEARLVLAQLRIVRGDLEDAIRLYEEVLDRNPAQSSALEGLVFLRQKKGEEEMAMKSILRAEQHVRGDEEKTVAVRIVRGNFHVARGEWLKAMSILEGIETDFPGNFRAFLATGMLHSMLAEEASKTAKMARSSDGATKAAARAFASQRMDELSDFYRKKGDATPGPSFQTSEDAFESVIALINVHKMKANEAFIQARKHCPKNLRDSLEAFVTENLLSQQKRFEKELEFAS